MCILKKTGFNSSIYRLQAQHLKSLWAVRCQLPLSSYLSSHHKDLRDWAAMLSQRDQPGRNDTLPAPSQAFWFFCFALRFPEKTEGCGAEPLCFLCCPKRASPVSPGVINLLLSYYKSIMFVKYVYQASFDRNKTKQKQTRLINAFCFYYWEHTGAGKMYQLLWTLTALGEDLGLGPSTHMAAQSSSSRVTLFWPPQALSTHVVHVHTFRQCTYTHKIQ